MRDIYFFLFKKKVVVAGLFIAFLVINVFKTAQSGSQEVDLNRYQYIAHANDETGTTPPDIGNKPFSLIGWLDGWLIRLGLWQES